MLAQQQMNHERSDHTLQATALVHEAYMRLIGPSEPDWPSRGYFFVRRSRRVAALPTRLRRK